jgi:hypothetical protein
MASRTAASSPVTTPYTVGPQELWPTPNAPPLPHLRDEIRSRSGRECAALHRREPASRDLLNLRERRAERLDVVLDDSRKERHQHQMCDARRIVVRRRRQLCERLDLAHTADAGGSVWHGDHTAPRVGERQSRDERPRSIAPRDDALPRRRVRPPRTSTCRSPSADLDQRRGRAPPGPCRGR